MTTAEQQGYVDGYLLKVGVDSSLPVPTEAFTPRYSYLRQNRGGPEISTLPRVVREQNRSTSFAENPQGRTTPDYEILGNNFTNKNVSYADVLRRQYGPVKAQQYIRDAAAYQAQHPEIPFGHDISKAYDRIPVKAYKSIEPWRTAWSSVLAGGNIQTKAVGYYNPMGQYVALSPAYASDTPVAKHELMHYLADRPWNVVENIRSVIPGAAVSTQYPVSAKAAKGLSSLRTTRIEELLPVLSELKHIARAHGFETRTPEDVTKWFDFARRYWSKEVNQPLYLNGREWYNHPQFEEAAKELLPGVARHSPSGKPVV